MTRVQISKALRSFVDSLPKVGHGDGTQRERPPQPAADEGRRGGGSGQLRALVLVILLLDVVKTLAKAADAKGQSRNFAAAKTSSQIVIPPSSSFVLEGQFSPERAFRGAPFRSTFFFFDDAVFLRIKV